MTNDKFIFSDQRHNNKHNKNKEQRLQNDISDIDFIMNDPRKVNKRKNGYADGQGDWIKAYHAAAPSPPSLK